MTEFTIVPSGSFSLRESVEFGFGQRHSTTFDGVMRLAFCLVGTHEQVGVEVRQDGDGVHGLVQGEADVDAVRAQVARVLSLDHDGSVFDDICARDPVLTRLHTLRPGLRPPLFHSPYEAAVWAVLSVRRPAHQAAQVRDRLSAEHGGTFTLAGQQLAALPTPAQLLDVDAFDGIPADRIPRLHAIARSALAGELDVVRLQALGPEQATVDLQRLPGIGPFYASLIVIRATGFADVLPDREPMLLERVAELYDGRSIQEVAERWRPMRTWAAVLVRATAGR